MVPGGCVFLPNGFPVPGLHPLGHVLIPQDGQQPRFLCLEDGLVGVRHELHSVHVHGRAAHRRVRDAELEVRLLDAARAVDIAGHAPVRLFEGVRVVLLQPLDAVFVEAVGPPLLPPAVVYEARLPAVLLHGVAEVHQNVLPLPGEVDERDPVVGHPGLQPFYAARGRRMIVHIHSFTNSSISRCSRRNTLATRNPSAMAWFMRTVTGIMSRPPSSRYLPQLTMGARYRYPSGSSR